MTNIFFQKILLCLLLQIDFDFFDCWKYCLIQCSFYLMKAKCTIKMYIWDDPYSCAPHSCWHQAKNLFAFMLISNYFPKGIIAWVIWKKTIFVHFAKYTISVVLTDAQSLYLSCISLFIHLNFIENIFWESKVPTLLVVKYSACTHARTVSKWNW